MLRSREYSTVLRLQLRLSQRSLQVNQHIEYLIRRYAQNLLVIRVHIDRCLGQHGAEIRFALASVELATT
jgi:hypothetical protein